MVFVEAPAWRDSRRRDLAPDTQRHVKRLKKKHRTQDAVHTAVYVLTVVYYR